MKKKGINGLAFFACVLLVLAYLVNRGSTGQGGVTTVFNSFPWGEISKITIEKGGESLEIQKESDEKWVIPSRANYKANSAEITSLTLKLADLTTSQKMNLNEDGLKRLGLTSDSKDQGQGVLTFYSKDGKEIEKLFIGGLRNRKNASTEDGGNLPGQFIKRASMKEAFLVPTPLALYPSLSTWLDTSVVSISDSEVQKVRAIVGGSEIYSLVKDENLKKLVFKGSVPQGQVIQDTVVSQIATGIKDVKLTDVAKSDSSDLASLEFSRQIDYYLSNGLVYKFFVAEKDSKKYLKVKVEFVSKEGGEPVPAASPDGKSGNVSSKEEAEKISSQYSQWIYEIPDYVATRFLRKYEDLFKNPVEASKPPAPVQG